MAGRDRKISDTCRKGYSCPMDENKEYTFGIDRYEQTPGKQSDLGLYCLPFDLHIFDQSTTQL